MAVESNGTYLSPLPSKRVLMLERISEEKEYSGVSANTWGVSCDVTPYYQRSLNSGKLAGYFAEWNEGGLQIDGPNAGKGAIRNYNIVYTGPLPINKLDPRGALFSNADSTASQWIQGDELYAAQNYLDATITYSPVREAWGVDVWFHKDLTFIHNSLSWDVLIPFVNVTQTMGIQYQGTASTPLPSSYTAPTAPLQSATIADYFAGNVSQPAGHWQQAALKYLKINGKRTKRGLSDIVTSLKWLAVSNDQGELLFRFFGVIPTSNKPTCEYLFEPMLGNNQHWGIGAGFDGMLTIANNDYCRVYAGMSCEATYLFKNQQMRTGGYFFDHSILDFIWYGLAGQDGQKGLFPAANILTQKADVQPGVYVESTVNLQLWAGPVGASLAYTLKGRGEEKVTFNKWPKGTYSIANQNYDGITNFSSTTNSLDGGTTPINLDSIDPEVAASPEVVTHTFHAMLSCRAIDYNDMKCSLSVGGDVSVAESHGAVTGYAIFGRLAFSF